MTTPSKIAGGPSHPIDRIRKRRKTGRINLAALGDGLSIDDQGRLVVTVPGSSTDTTVGGSLNDFTLARSVKNAAQKVYAWSAFK